jgi:hypothetical protein
MSFFIILISEYFLLHNCSAIKGQGDARVFSEPVVLLPGDPWAKAEEMRDRFGIV